MKRMNKNITIGETISSFYFFTLGLGFYIFLF